MTEKLDAEQLGLLKKHIQENLLVILLKALIDTELPINCKGYGTTIVSYYETSPTHDGSKGVVCKLKIPYILEEIDVAVQLPQITFPKPDHVQSQEESK